MKEPSARRREAVVPLLVGVLLGFIGGYFAAGGGRPASPATEQAARLAEGDRLDELRRLIEKDPENPKLLTSLGNTYYDSENWDGAVEAYEKARRKASSDSNLLSDLGAAYRNRGEFRRAVSLFEKARSADPDHWQSLVNLVLVSAFDARDASAAQRYFDELKRRYPSAPNLDRIQEQISRLRTG